ncbi:integrase, catalytic region, zinc finger, CCHC-type containing protein [Tanacetum coccineum]|uniref:Integrase, catalytic region, zinc finger, CCHC-type containing protein n=1 Tax=Tanacetum coccineum TaxID=301880 RepID=A0ABQ5IW32_9ASTR
MTDTYFVEYTGLEVQHFRDTLLQHLGNVKKSVAERTHHQRQYERRVNKRQMQTQESKIDTGKALDADLVDTESIRTDSTVQDDSSRSGNDTDADDADIRPIYDEEPMAEVQLTAECNIFAIGQQHTEQPEIIVERLQEQTTSLLANNAELKAQIQGTGVSLMQNHDDCITKLLKEVNSRAKIQSNMTTNSNKPVDQKSHTQKPSRQVFTGHRFSPNKTSAVFEKTSPRSNLRWKPTGRIFKSVGLRWIPTGKLFDSCTRQGEVTHGSIVDIPHIHACKQTLGLSAGTSFNGQKQQRIDLNADALHNEKQENLRVWPLQTSLYNDKWCLLKITLQAPFLNVQKTFVHSRSSLGLHQMTSDHNRSELEIQDHSNELKCGKAHERVEIKVNHLLFKILNQFVIGRLENSHHEMVNLLESYYSRMAKNEVNEIRVERLARTANPLARVAQQQPVYHPHKTILTQKHSFSSTVRKSTRNRGRALVTSSAPILIQTCYGIWGMFPRECQKPKRVKDAAYHKEKMLLCKQEEAGVQLNAEQADWKDDTDDESDDQELEAHYMYMAQLQEVTPDPVDNSGPIFDDEPTHKLVEIILFIVDSGCSKHMTGNLKLLTNFVEKFLGTVKFGNDQIAPILGYGDLVQGAITIKRVYYVEGLNHNLFSVGQFCDADLEVAFRKSSCYIRDLKGNDLLTGSRGIYLYSIPLQDSTSPNPICLMAKATSSQAWLWHRRLSHLNFDTINLLSKNNIVNGLPKLKFVKDHLCSSCELGKAKRKSFHTKTTPSSKRRLQLYTGTYGSNADGENLDKMKEKGDACIFVGYSTQSKAYRVFNKRTRMIVETIHVNFDELPQMASDHVSSDPGPQCSTTVLEQGSLSPGPQSQENVPQVAETEHRSNELELLYSPMFNTPPLNIHSTHQTPTPVPTVIAPENIHQAETNTENAQFDDDEFINIFSTPVQEQGETSSRHVESFKHASFL